MVDKGGLVVRLRLRFRFRLRLSYRLRLRLSYRLRFRLRLRLSYRLRLRLSYRLRLRFRLRLSYRLRLRVWVSLAKGGLAVRLSASGLGLEDSRNWLRSSQFRANPLSLSQSAKPKG